MRTSKSCGTGSGASPGGQSEISVLVVDDEPGILLLIEMLIKRFDNGLRLVGSAAGGHECLRLWEQLRPDVVVLDLSMPDLHGRDVAQRIHASDPEQAIVLFSAHIDATTTTTESLHVPKSRMAELPALIHQWMSTRNATIRCPGASSPRTAP